MIPYTARNCLYAPLQVLVYSSNADARLFIERSLGGLADTEGAPLDFIQAATRRAVMQHMASGVVDVAIMDGEASPAGGLGIAKQLKDELLQCPPIIVLTGRDDDAWLARWSRADAVVAYPIDPLVLSQIVAPLLQSRLNL
ncbi:MAG: response regulator [Mycobacterium sp.]